MSQSRASDSDRTDKKTTTATATQLSQFTAVYEQQATAKSSVDIVMFGENFDFLVPCAVAIAVLAFTTAYYLSRSKARLNTQSATEKPSSKSQKSTKTTKKKQPVNDTPEITTKVTPADDVWGKRRKMGISNTTTDGKQKEQSHKPFGSSYYYAHNNTDAKGGYTDGLQIEDFTMNGPRLLSRGGQTVTEATENAQQPGRKQPNPSPSAEKKKSTHPKARQITRYLWDDDGVDTGVAVIRIDELPSERPNETIPWVDADVRDAIAKVVGDRGLLVSVKTGDDKIEHRLYIKQMYGDVTTVKAVVKAKRLLVKLYKVKDKENLKAWPHPQKKV